MTRRYLRPGIVAGHVLVLLAVLTCLRLGWWQWDVTHEARGTVQNFGYALLWPTFGAAFIFMWIRFLQLEDVREREAAEATADGSGDEDANLESIPRHDATPAGTVVEVGRDQQVSDGAIADDRPGVGDAIVTGDAVGAVHAGDAAAAGPHTETDGASSKRRRSTPRRRRPENRPSQSVVIAIATVGGDDDDDDPELAAYNRALAELAEKDRRAR